MLRRLENTAGATCSPNWTFAARPRTGGIATTVIARTAHCRPSTHRLRNGTPPPTTSDKFEKTKALVCQARGVPIRTPKPLIASRLRRQRHWKTWNSSHAVHFYPPEKYIVISLIVATENAVCASTRLNKNGRQRTGCTSCDFVDDAASRRGQRRNTASSTRRGLMPTTATDASPEDRAIDR